MSSDVEINALPSACVDPRIISGQTTTLMNGLFYSTLADFMTGVAGEINTLHSEIMNLHSSIHGNNVMLHKLNQLVREHGNQELIERVSSILIDFDSDTKGASA